MTMEPDGPGPAKGWPRIGEVTTRTVAPPPRSRGRPSLQTAAQIDREILDAALQQFLMHGYGDTSMAMIIKAAGVSKTTLYARYATKSELFHAIVRRTVDETQNVTLRPGRELSHDLEEGLRTFAYTALKVSLVPLWANYERLIYSEGPRFPELAHSITDRIELAIETVTRFIMECAERDGVPCRDPLAVARTYVMAVRGYYSEMVLSNREPGAQECADFVAELVRTLVSGRAGW